MKKMEKLKIDENERNWVKKEVDMYNPYKEGNELQEWDE